MSEFELKSNFTISEMTADDYDAATLQRKQSWKDTYTNPELGVTEEWIEARFADKISEEGREARKKYFNDTKQAGKCNAWIARTENGEIIGSAIPFITPQGIQRVGSIYVDKRWHGSGVGSQLMQRIIDWFDPEEPIHLGVASYNDRAKAFYKKWGFEEIPDSETFFGDILPEIRMIRHPHTNDTKEKK